MIKFNKATATELEALEQAGLAEKKPLTEWAAVKIPQVGGGRWKR